MEHGLVSRDEDPDDRRLVIASLTEVGRAMLDRTQEVRRDRFSRVLGRMSADELQIVARAVDLLYTKVLAEVSGSDRSA